MPKRGLNTLVNAGELTRWSTMNGGGGAPVEYTLAESKVLERNFLVRPNIYNGEETKRSPR